MKKVKVTLTIDDEIWEAFRKHVEGTGMSASAWLELMMKTTMDSDKKSVHDLLKDAMREGLGIIARGKKK